MELSDLVREFLDLLEIEEESDSGRRFHPNRIASCRATDGQRLSDLLVKMRDLTKRPKLNG